MDAGEAAKSQMVALCAAVVQSAGELPRAAVVGGPDGGRRLGRWRASQSR